MSDKPKLGRPPKPLDFTKLENLLEMYPTKKYIATFFDCSEDHIVNEIERQYGCSFSALRERAIEGKKKEVLGWAYKYAANGNERLIIFLMKNMLSWNDKVEIQASEQQMFQLKYAIEKKIHDAQNTIDTEAKQIEQPKADDNNTE